MSSTKTKGEISKKLYYDIEWTVEDILSPAEPDEFYHSPRFSIPGSEWYFRIYPNGLTAENAVGWIGVFLMRGSDQSVPPKTVNYRFGVKKADGNVDMLMAESSNEFVKIGVGRGPPKLLQRSKLLNPLLTPTGALTIICTMKVKDNWECISRLVELSDNFKDMFVSAKSCDTTLKVQNREFSVHKSILASRSSVFDAMFQVDMKEKTTGTVDIVDCHPEAFNDFLVYIYSGQFQTSSGEVFELYKIAHKYCAEQLKEACVCFILNNLSVDNVIDVATFGDHFDEDDFRSKAQDFFDENFKDIVATDKWNLLLRKNPFLANKLLTYMTKNTEIKKKQS